ncbi:MAG: hypothetical protein IJM81_08410, partial [Prevotella sp.]|nr:hypothetical protein [Prevotella sp.]
KSIGIARQYEDYEKYLYKRGRFEEIIAINEPPQSTPSLVYSTAHHQMHRDEEAEQIFASLINKEPDNLPARKGYARAAYRLGHYHEAAEAYHYLNGKMPENLNLQLSYAMALIADERAEEAIGILYKIHFEHPDNLRAMRVLAWAHLADGNTQKADDLYARILSSGNVTADDYLNAGYAKWFKKNINEAAQLFRQCLQHAPKTHQDLAVLFETDRRLLIRRGITTADRHLMANIVEENEM